MFIKRNIQDIGIYSLCSHFTLIFMQYFENFIKKMKTLKIFLALFASTLFVSEGVAQNSVQLSDIEMVNMGDKQLYAHKRGDYASPVEGKTRIITGVTTEYIDAEFAAGFATGKWEYYANNKKTVVMNYKNGYLDGEYSKFYPGGDLEIRGIYLKARKNGKWETFKSDGVIKLTEVFENDSRIKTITYFTDGTVDRERNFKNGKEHGVDRQYVFEGGMKSEKNYSNGKQVGPQLQYYSSNAGNYIQKSNYNEQGKLDGAFSETYDEGGALKVKGQYKDGRKVGKWTYENKKGESIKVETYENGKLVDK